MEREKWEGHSSDKEVPEEGGKTCHENEIIEKTKIWEAEGDAAKKNRVILFQ